MTHRQWNYLLLPSFWWKDRYFHYFSVLLYPWLSPKHLINYTSIWKCQVREKKAGDNQGEGMTAIIQEPKAAFVPISRYFRHIIVSSYPRFLTYFPNLGLQLILRKLRSDFTDSFLLLSLPAAAVSVIISTAVIPSATQNSHPPKNTPLQIHLLSWLDKFQLQRLFSWDFLNQINVFLLASTGMIGNFTCHSSD